MANFFKNPLGMFFPKKIVGVDVGSSSVKVVEISYWKKTKTLENYGEIKSNLIYRDPIGSAKDGNSLPSSAFVAKAVRAILDEAGIKTKKAIFSIPDFSTFCTSFDIPPMTEKEIPGAIRFNASQYITMPVSEVALDWRIISNPQGNKNAPLKIFLIAIPNQVINEYKSIAKMAGLELYALEAEVLGITKSLIKDNKKTICVVDIGVQSSIISIVDNGFLRRSYSFNFYSNQLSRAVSSVLGISLEKAEEIKNKEGIISQRPGVAETLYPLIDSLLTEIKGISAEFFQAEQKQVQEIYLTGGTANLPGLREYFNESIKKNVYIPNCFSDLLYPPILEKTLRDMAPSFSGAVGVALGGLEN